MTPLLGSIPAQEIFDYNTRIRKHFPNLQEFESVFMTYTPKDFQKAGYFCVILYDADVAWMRENIPGQFVRFGIDYFFSDPSTPEVLGAILRWGMKKNNG